MAQIINALTQFSVRLTYVNVRVCSKNVNVVREIQHLEWKQNLG